MTWTGFTRAVLFALGVAILVLAILDEPIHWGLVALALVLVGVITGDQLRAMLGGRRPSFAPEPMAGRPSTPPPGYVPPEPPHGPPTAS